jgi:hypothetical protein
LSLLSKIVNNDNRYVKGRRRQNRKGEPDNTHPAGTGAVSPRPGGRMLGDVQARPMMTARQG